MIDFLLQDHLRLVAIALAGTWIPGLKIVEPMLLAKTHWRSQIQHFCISDLKCRNVGSAISNDLGEVLIDPG
jgi:hypothetical protein